MEQRPVGQAFVVHAIERLLARVRSAYKIVGELDACMTTEFNGREEFEAQRREALVYTIGLLGRQLPVLLDLMGMSATRRSFLKAWEALEPDLGATGAIAIGEEMVLISPPLELIDEIVRVLGDGAKGVSNEDPAGIKILEYVLRSIPQILRVRRVKPRKEADIQQVLDDHLRSTFPDYSKGVRLPKGLKNFVPDGAIPSLEVLVEVKFVDSEEKMAPIFSGIMEDLSGYGGSRDWSRYYSLIYQTEPFENEVRFGQSLRLSGNARQWRPIVVVGSGG